MKALVLLVLAVGGAVGGESQSCLGKANFVVRPNCNSGQPSDVSPEEYDYIKSTLPSNEQGFFDEVGCDPNALKVGDRLSFTYSVENKCQLTQPTDPDYVPENVRRRPPPRMCGRVRHARHHADATLSRSSAHRAT